MSPSVRLGLKHLIDICFSSSVSLSNLFICWSPVKRTWYPTHQSCWSVQSGSSTTIRLYQECEGSTLPPLDWSPPAWWVCQHNTDKHYMTREAFLVLAIVCFDRIMSWKRFVVSVLFLNYHCVSEFNFHIFCGVCLQKSLFIFIYNLINFSWSVVSVFHDMFLPFKVIG